MVAGAAISTDLSDAAWLKALQSIGEKGGYYSSLGDKHAAVLVEACIDGIADSRLARDELQLESLLNSKRRECLVRFGRSDPRQFIGQRRLVVVLSHAGCGDN